MKRILILLIILMSCSLTDVSAQQFECEDPAWYTLGEELYANSPSTQMALAEYFIGLFMNLRAQPGEEDIAQANADLEQRVRISRQWIGGRPILVITPASVRNDKIVVYFHGGSYRDELILPQLEMAIDLSRKSGSPVYIVDYRLSTEAIFPAAVEDGIAIHMELLETFDPSQIIFMGDSAGGGLALGLTGKIRDEGLPLPERLVLISPWLDVEGDNPDMPEYDEADQMLSVAGLQNAGRAYVGPDNLENLDNPYASPILLEELIELPPTLILMGTNDILYPDALLFSNKALSEDMELTFVVVNQAFHVWPAAPAWLVPEAAWARRQIASFINCYSLNGRSGYSALSIMDLNIHPNPTSDLVSIFLPLAEYRVELFSTDGKRIKDMTTIGTMLQLNLANMPHGLYMVRVQNIEDDSVRFGKVIKVD